MLYMRRVTKSAGKAYLTDAPQSGEIQSPEKEVGWEELTKCVYGIDLGFSEFCPA